MLRRESKGTRCATAGPGKGRTYYGVTGAARAKTPARTDSGERSWKLSQKSLDKKARQAGTKEERGQKGKQEKKMASFLSAWEMPGSLYVSMNSFYSDSHPSRQVLSLSPFYK